MEPTFRSPFSYGISNSGKRLPRNGLLLYLARPNSDEYLVGEDTETGEDTYIWGYVLPDDADIRAATGWVNGTANVFYTTTGVPIVALATEIAQAVLPANVVFSLTDAATQTGKLAIYTAETTAATLAKARSVLRDESINYLFYGRTAIAYDPQDLTTMYQDAQGTLPVYRPGSGAVDPPVGRLLDKSKGLELGPELVVNGDFATGDLSSWLKVGTMGTQEYVDGGCLVTHTLGDSAWSAREQNLSSKINVGKTYILEADITRQALSEVFLGLWVGAAVQGPLHSGSIGEKVRYRWIYTTTSTTFYLRFACYAGGAALFDNISVREIKGYHAYQSTTTARPTLSGRYNLLLATETLSTQSVTTAATDYTFRFEGAGTVTLSGTATGVLSAGTHTVTCTAGTLTLTVAGSVTKADLRVKRDGSSLPPYQRVDSATTYDTNGFPLYLRRDKVDDDLIVQAPAITGSWAHGTINGPVLGTVAIPAGEYHPFGTFLTGGLETCTQWIAIDGALTTSEQAVLEWYVYAKARQLIDVPQFGGVANMNSWLYQRQKITSIDTENWDTSNVTSLSNFAFQCTLLQSIDLSKFNTSKVTNIGAMLNGCVNLAEIDVSGWDSSKFTNIGYAFQLTKASTLDLSGWTLPLCTSAYAFANGSSSLTTVIVGNAFDNTPCTNFTNAFTNTNLNQASIDAILVSINTAGTSNGTFNQSGGSAPSATGQAAITAMRSRGWTVTVTGGF